MECNPNKAPAQVIKEGHFGGTSFRDIYSGANGKWYRNSWKEFNELKNIDQKFRCSDYYDVDLNKYKVKTGISLRLWENKGWINKINPSEWFQWYFRYFLGRRSSYDFRQINKCKTNEKIVFYYFKGGAIESNIQHPTLMLNIGYWVLEPFARYFFKYWLMDEIFHPA